MPRHFAAPGPQILQSSGLPYSGCQAFFYSPGTTTPLNVYSDSALTTPVTQPAVADSAGRFAQIYLQPVPYRIQLKTSGGVLIADYDNVDEGPGNTGGVTAITSGGTGATTAGGARSNLGLGTAAVVDTGTATGRVPLITATTWTPALTFGGGSTGLTYSLRSGIYQQIGNLIVAQGTIQLSAKGSSTGNAAITGWPVAASASLAAPVLVYFFSGMSGITSGNIVGAITAGTSSAAISFGGAVNMTTIQDTNFTNASIITFFATYSA